MVIVFQKNSILTVTTLYSTVLSSFLGTGYAVELVRGGSSRVREDNLCAGCCRVEGFRGWV